MILNKFSQYLIEEYKAVIALWSPADLAYEIATLRKEWLCHSEIQKLDDFQKECISLLEKEIAKRSVEK